MIYYNEIVKIKRPLRALLFIMIWIFPFGLQYIILATNKGKRWVNSAINIDKRLYHHYKLQDYVNIKELYNMGVVVL